MAEQRRRRRAPCAPEARPRSPSSPWGRRRPAPGARHGPGGGAAGRPGPLAGRLCPGAHVVSAIAAPALAPDLEAALRRLMLTADRRLPPELPARDASTPRARLRFAAFPVRKTLDEFLVPESAIPRATFDYLASLEWIRARENLVLVGPAGTGKSHTRLAVGHAPGEAGIRVRHF